MENSNAQKLIKEIQGEIISNGIDSNSIVPKLKKLREFALLEENPIVVKALRLTYEHIEKNNDFLISIPSDEPVDENEVNEFNSTNTESLNYLLSLVSDLENKHNILDLKDYNKLLLEF